MTKTQIAVIIVLFALSLFSVHLLTLRLSKIFNIHSTMWFQAFISDPYFYSKVKKNMNQQLATVPEISVIEVDSFDNIYRWTLIDNEVRFQVRAFPVKKGEHIKLEILKINDQNATEECREQEGNMVLSGISGESGTGLNRATGIEFTTLADIHNNLDSIVAEVKTWPMVVNNNDTSGYQSVLYNCEIKVIFLK